jgi:hypothetical protein
MTGQLDRGCALVSLSLLSWSAIRFIIIGCAALDPIELGISDNSGIHAFSKLFLEPRGLLDAL